MKLATLTLVFLACMPLATFADTATFGNNGGNFQVTGDTVAGSLNASNNGDLQLTGSFLTQISGLAPIIPNSSAAFPTCTSGGCLGSVTLTTGALTTGANFTPATGTTNGSTGGFVNTTKTNVNVNDQFAGGGTFKVTSGTSVFQGTFAAGATWTCVASTSHQCNGVSGGTWTLAGNIIDGTLTVGGKTYNIMSGATVQLTTPSGAPVVTRVPAGTGTITGIKFTDNSGTTDFMSPVPEPGTLTLLGGGLIGIAVLMRRRIARSSNQAASALETA